jgi:predicted nucleic acid-binding Zn ribbon protein
MPSKYDACPACAATVNRGDLVCSKCGYDLYDFTLRRAIRQEPWVFVILGLWVLLKVLIIGEFPRF